MLSMFMALAALAVDLMLPAFGEMRVAFGLAVDSNAIAATVTTYVLGVALGSLFFGPLSDRFGRKPALYLGFGVYAVGAIASALAPTLGFLLAARAFWGFGAASARTIALAIIRDVYEGDRMARTMSFVLSVFLLVPIVAPSIGAAIVEVAPWQSVFWAAALVVVAMSIWSARLPETLDPANQLLLRPNDLVLAVKQVLMTRQTLGHMLAFTVSFGAFISYLASSQLIVDDVLGHPEQFPLIFGGLSAVFAAAILLNGTIVERFGTLRVLRATLIAYVAGAVVLLSLALATDGRPSLWPFLISVAFVLAMHAMLVPNVNSRAMDPMGAIAGTASAVISAVTGIVGAIIGASIDRLYNGTITPLAIGFVLSSILAALLATWAERPHANTP
jgi:DHA1 family bicyclomycin/chloramphenicol resistance-like MFS transporter